MADKPKNIEELIELWLDRLQAAFSAGVSKITERANLAQIMEFLQAGNIDAALAALDINPLAFREFETILERVYEEGGDFTMERIPAARFPSGFRLNIMFNARAVQAENWLELRSSNMITQITEDIKIAARQHLTAGMAEGNNPRTVATGLIGKRDPKTHLRSGGIIGLTSRQEEWVRKYEQELRSGDPNSLRRALRDKRFDRTVAKAIREGKPISAEVREKMVSAYKSKALKYRAETISRTEAMTALHASQEEAFRQAIEAGQVDEARIYKIWHSASDRRVRDTHRHLNGKRVPFNGYFISQSGARLRFPGDPEGPPEEIINCRCWMETKIDYFKGVR